MILKLRETLLSSLLDIQERIMNQSNKYVLISSVTLADDLADYLVEVCDFKCFRIHIKKIQNLCRNYLF